MRRERSVEPWPWIVAGTLACMGAVLGALLWLAEAHPVALAVDDAYQAGLRYNDEDARRGRAEARGWDLELWASREAGAIDVRVRLYSAGAPWPVRPAVEVERLHPSRTDFDETFKLAPQGADFVGRIPLPGSSRWVLVARAGDGDARVVRRFAVDPLP